MRKKVLFNSNKDLNSVTGNKQKTKILTILCLFIVAIVCLSVSQIIRYLSLPKKMIGEADAMALIIIKDDSFLNISSIFLIIGLIFVSIVPLLIIKYVSIKNKQN